MILLPILSLVSDRASLYFLLNMHSLYIVSECRLLSGYQHLLDLYINYFQILESYFKQLMLTNSHHRPEFIDIIGPYKL